MAILTQDEIINKLSSLPGWEQEGNQISKLFQYKNFAEALAFVNRVGEDAEKMDHHPDIFIYSWNKVKITISTHSEGGITNKDFQLAEIIERIIL